MTNNLIKYLNKRIIPWRNDFGLPRDIAHKTHSPVNILILNAATEVNRYNSPFWATKEQWNSVGCKVRYWEQPTLSYYNKDQVDGSFACAADPVMSFNEVDKLIVDTKVNIKFSHKLIAEYHYPPNDYILFPYKIHFDMGEGKEAGYYNAIFHELAHFTEPKLGWESEKYGVPVTELRAEIAADFITSYLRLPRLAFNLRSNHHKWMADWVMALSYAPNLLVAAAASAYNAFRLIVKKYANVY